VRRATAADVADVAEIWRAGWHDAHDGLVSTELAAVRTDQSFVQRAAERVADTSVAVVAGQVAGFVMVVDDEVEQVYVSSGHRGSGVAGLLLDSAERQVAAGGQRSAWLAVASGNARARRFYEKRGWVDDGEFAYPAQGPDGPIDVACHRYSKRVL
jgi:ribosomal protein S18 acetylase RimI-like enzyme